MNSPRRVCTLMSAFTERAMELRGVRDGGSAALFLAPAAFPAAKRSRSPSADLRGRAAPAPSLAPCWACSSRLPLLRRPPWGEPPLVAAWLALRPFRPLDRRAARGWPRRCRRRFRRRFFAGAAAGDHARQPHRRLRRDRADPVASACAPAALTALGRRAGRRAFVLVAAGAAFARRLPRAAAAAAAGARRRTGPRGGAGLAPRRAGRFAVLAFALALLPWLGGSSLSACLLGRAVRRLRLRPLRPGASADRRPDRRCRRGGATGRGNHDAAGFRRSGGMRSAFSRRLAFDNLPDRSILGYLPWRRPDAGEIAKWLTWTTRRGKRSCVNLAAQVDASMSVCVFA